MQWPPGSQTLPGQGCQGGGLPWPLTRNTLTLLLLPLPLKIQQRRQELEQSLVVRNT
jgi:hypothetical protein